MTSKNSAPKISAPKNDTIRAADFPDEFLRGKKTGNQPRKFKELVYDGPDGNKIRLIVVQPPMLMLAANINDINIIGSTGGLIVGKAALKTQGFNLDEDTFFKIRSYIYEMFAANFGFWSSYESIQNLGGQDRKVFVEGWTCFANDLGLMDEMLTPQIIETAMLEWVDLCVGPLGDGKSRVESKAQAVAELMSGISSGKNLETMEQSSQA